MTFMIKKKKTPSVAVYHWWSEPTDPEPYRNLRTPVVISIATMRSVSSIPIVVLDATPHNNDWGKFPELLKFQVVPISCTFEKNRDQVAGWKHLSRIHDIREWSDKTFDSPNDILYSDCDVFWFRDPIPFCKNTDRFVFDGWNSGCFYYNSSSKDFKKFFEKYDSYTRLAIESEETRKLMQKYVPYDSWYGVWDEMMLTYMFRESPELFHLMPLYEHATIKKLQKDENEIKMLHCNGLRVENPFTGEKHFRGLIPILFEELYKNISKILLKQELEEIYGQEILNYCLSKQISLFERIEELKTNTEEGQCRLNSLL
jgi:hypothetical protein